MADIIEFRQRRAQDDSSVTEPTAYRCDIATLRLLVETHKKLVDYAAATSAWATEFLDSGVLPAIRSQLEEVRRVSDADAATYQETHRQFAEYLKTAESNEPA